MYLHTITTITITDGEVKDTRVHIANATEPTGEIGIPETTTRYPNNWDTVVIVTVRVS